MPIFSRWDWAFTWFPSRPPDPQFAWPAAYGPRGQRAAVRGERFPCSPGLFRHTRRTQLPIVRPAERSKGTEWNHLAIISTHALICHLVKAATAPGAQTERRDCAGA